MKRTLVLTMGLSLLAAAFAQAGGNKVEATKQAPATVSVGHDPHLQPIDWLTRGVWTAEFTTADGKPFLIQEEIRWGENGTAIYFSTRFNHEPRYDGLYAYDPATRQIRFFYSSSKRELTVGHAEATPTGLRQAFQVSSEEGVTSYTSTLTRDGDDVYDCAVYEPGITKPVVAVQYARK